MVDDAEPMSSSSSSCADVTVGGGIFLLVVVDGFGLFIVICMCTPWKANRKERKGERVGVCEYLNRIFFRFLLQVVVVSPQWR